MLGLRLSLEDEKEKAQLMIYQLLTIQTYMNDRTI